jgi:ABC-2 type transport system permease protein
MRKLVAMVWKDIYLTFTDRMALILMLVTPFAISLIIGMAFGGLGGGGDVPISDIEVVVVNRDQGAETPTGQMLNMGAQLVEFFVSPPYEALDQLLNASEIADWDAARGMVESDDSDIVAAILIPEDFSAQATAQQQGMSVSLGQGTITLYHKSASPISSSVVESVLTGWANRISTGSITAKVGIEETISRMGAQSFQVIGELTGKLGEAYTATPITIEEQSAGGERQEFNILSVIAPSMAIFFLLFSTTFGAGEFLTEQRQWTLQRMITTPTPRSMILSGKMVATYLSGVLQVTILLIATSLLGADWGSDMLPIALLVLVAVAAATGLGALLASLVKRPEQMGIYGVGILMVMGILSGSFTNTQFLGDAKIISQLTLNWWAIEGFAKLATGGGFSDIVPHLAVLSLMAVIFFVIGVWRFRRRLDF